MYKAEEQDGGVECIIKRKYRQISSRWRVLKKQGKIIKEKKN